MNSVLPLIFDAGNLAAVGSLPLYRETDWNFRTNKPVWRFAHDVFSANYGPDFTGLIGQSYTEEVRQSEAIRIVRETLMVNPYITNVTQVSVSFADSTLHLHCKMTTVYGEVTIDGCDIAL